MWKLQHRSCNVIIEGSLQRSIYVGYGTWNRKHCFRGFSTKIRIQNIIRDWLYVNCDHTSRGKYQVQERNRGILWNSIHRYDQERGGSYYVVDRQDKL